MLTALKSMLSNYVAPGGCYAPASPFSFFPRINVVTNVTQDVVEMERVKESLKAIVSSLESDDLRRGREQAVALLVSLEAPHDS